VSRMTRPATRADLEWIRTPAVRAHVVADAGELVALSEAEPWRVRVTGRGEAAVIGPWREHLHDCAVFGLWCSPRRVSALAADLVDVAREQGFDRLVGPLVAESEAGAYVEAGLCPVERIVVMRAKVPASARSAATPEGLVIREVTESDVDALLRLDAECFEPFWHYDRASLARFARTAGRRG
jgi:hypothetical protein